MITYQKKITTILLLFMLIPIFFSTVGCVPKEAINESELPVEEQYALNQYNKDTIKEEMVTIRRDILKVTKRELSRPNVKMLGDTHTITGTDITATFPSYPGFYKYHDITTDYTNTAEGLNFYKYMLLRQGDNLLEDSLAKFNAQTFTQENLYKHPAADDQFGEVKGTNNAVRKEITIDPSYRSLHTTGLYMPAGELISFKVAGLKKGESLNVVFNRQSDNYFNQNNEYYEKTNEFIKQGKYSEITMPSKLARTNNRLPNIQASITLNQNKEYFYGNPFGGVIFFDIGKTYSSVKVTVTGSVETPHYILGVTTPEYFDTYLKNAPGVISSLDTENGILIGPAEPMKKIETLDIENLALLWHSFFTVNESFTGGPYNANNLVTFDSFVPAGAAVHLGGGHSACPSSWYEGAMDYESLLRYGTWGVLHEVGHGNANAYGSIWGLGGSQEGEVRNNAITVLCYLMLGDMGTYHGANVEHGFVTHPYDSLNHTLTNIPATTKDYNEVEYFGALSTYSNIMHAFGTNKFYELMYSYKTNPKYCENKRADFLYRCALIYGQNFRYYFNELLYCKIEDNMLTSEQWALINSLPSYIPIANYFAGTIDGIKTGGDNLIIQGETLTMDIIGKMLSPKAFDIIEIKQPEHGNLVKNEDKTYTYKTSSEYYPTDQFEVIVVQENNIIHTFTMSFRIQITGSETKRYENVIANSVAEALLFTQTKSPDNTFMSKIAGISKYSISSGQGKVFDISSFMFVPDKDKKYSFYLKADDMAQLMYSSDNLDFKLAIDIPKYTNSYSEEYSFTLDLKKGTPIYFKLYTLNTGGGGFSEVAIKNNSEKIISIPSNMFYPVGVKEEDVKKAKLYSNFSQKFIVSKKTGIGSGTLLSNKNDWDIISAPNAQGGNTYNEILKDENGDFLNEITRNKTDFLIDGLINTEYHSVWNGENKTPIPHIYTVDTKYIQSFNFYKIYTRNNVNSFIKNYKLEYSTDDLNYKIISENDTLKYTNLCATFNFDTIEARYLKLTIYSTTGTSNEEYFTVITELDAGVSANAEKIAPITSSKIYTTGKWNNSEEYLNLQTGMLATEAKNQKMVIKFTGDRIALYSTLDVGFGLAEVFVDGKLYGIVDLNSDSMKQNQLIFTRDNLNQGEHTVEIKTINEGVFNVSFIGLSYAGALIQASNIYLERVLINIIIVLLVLLLLTIAFTVLLYRAPWFRKIMMSDKLILKIENNYEEAKAKRQIKKDLMGFDGCKEEELAKVVSSAPKSTAKGKNSSFNQTITPNSVSTKSQTSSANKATSPTKTSDSTIVGKKSIKKEPK